MEYWYRKTELASRRPGFWRRLRSLATALGIAFVFAFAAFLPAEAAEGLRDGDRFPDLAGFALEGELPPDLDGKVLMIDFWASWCPPCRVSFPVFDEFERTYAPRGLRIIAVSVDENASAYAAFLRRMRPVFTTVRDTDHRLAEAAKVPAMPTTYLVDRTGTIRYVHEGFSGDRSRRQLIAAIEGLLAERSAE